MSGKTDSVGIYESSIGKVKGASLNIKKNEPFFSFKLEPVTGDYKYDNKDVQLFGVVTQLSLTKAEVLSVTPTIGSDIYLYVGGESANEIVMSGVGFQSCSKEGSNKEHGIIRLLNYYYDNNVAKTGKACKLILNNGITFRAYLHSYRIENLPKLDNLFSFAFRFYGIKAK